MELFFSTGIPNWSNCFLLLRRKIAKTRRRRDQSVFTVRRSIYAISMSYSKCSISLDKYQVRLDCLCLSTCSTGCFKNQVSLSRKQNSSNSFVLKLFVFVIRSINLNLPHRKIRNCSNYSVPQNLSRSSSNLNS